MPPSCRPIVALAAPGEIDKAALPYTNRPGVPEDGEPGPRPLDRADVLALTRRRPEPTVADSRAEATHRDQDAFDAMLPELLVEHRGEHVLFKDGQVVSFHAGWQEAYDAGLDRFGLDTPFIVAVVAG